MFKCIEVKELIEFLFFIFFFAITADMYYYLIFELFISNPIQS